jgi:bifunctional non-homologous end joining protein LigD
MRQPIFVGLREDKPAHSVRRELPQSIEIESNASPTGQPTLTNLSKVYWPAGKLTKGDLIDYYRDVAPVMLPYLRDRPQSLHRHPNGIDGKDFFQKDVGKHPPPEWVQTTLIPSDRGDPVRYLLCQDEATLLYLANLGCIEINPWNSRVGSLDRPDYLVIDLDPQDLPFERVIETAQVVRSLLDKCGADSCCKTSGKRGLHIFVPMGRQHTTDHVRQFAELLAHLAHAELPETTSIVRPPAQRRRRVYLDYLQNRRGQTMAAAYSIRPVPGAMVSTPLRWSEVRKGLDPSKFTIRTIRRRLDRVGDLWQPVLKSGVDLQQCLERLQTS